MYGNKQAKFPACGMSCVMTDFSYLIIHCLIIPPDEFSKNTANIEHDNFLCVLMFRYQ